MHASDVGWEHVVLHPAPTCWFAGPSFSSSSSFSSSLMSDEMWWTGSHSWIQLLLPSSLCEVALLAQCLRKRSRYVQQKDKTLEHYDPPFSSSSRPTLPTGLLVTFQSKKCDVDVAQYVASHTTILATCFPRRICYALSFFKCPVGRGGGGEVASRHQTSPPRAGKVLR